MWITYICDSTVCFTSTSTTCAWHYVGGSVPHGAVSDEHDDDHDDHADEQDPVKHHGEKITLIEAPPAEGGCWVLHPSAHTNPATPGGLGHDGHDAAVRVASPAGRVELHVARVRGTLREILPVGHAHTPGSSGPSALLHVIVVVLETPAPGPSPGEGRVHVAYVLHVHPERLGHVVP